MNWKRPKCSDNSGKTPGVSSTRQSGDEFAVPGSYEVVYTVTDGKNENKNCSFRITTKSEYLLQRLPMTHDPESDKVAFYMAGIMQ